jgi:hypothetical protein
MSHARQIGKRNENRSRNWILKHPLEYCILNEGYIAMTPLGAKDFFSIQYDVDKNGKPMYAGFDIMATSLLTEQIYVIQSKTNKHTMSLDDISYINALSSIKLPSFFHKELHIWYTKNQTPKIIKL